MRKKQKADHLMSFREIAERTNVSTAYAHRKCAETLLTIWDGLRPAAPSSVDAVLALADYFNVDPEYMMRELLRADPGGNIKHDILKEIVD